MTSKNNKRKSSAVTNEDSNPQIEYEFAIRDGNIPKFAKLAQSKNISVASPLALQFAAQSTNGQFFETIAPKITRKDLLQFVTVCQTFGHTQPEKMEKTTAHEVSQMTTENNNTTSKKLPQNLVEKLANNWVFKPQRVVWTEDYCMKKQTELNQKDCEQKWLFLIQFAKDFESLGANASRELQDQLFQILEDRERRAKNIAKDADENFEKKLEHRRQTARRVFPRLLYLEKMVFNITVRDANSIEKTKKTMFVNLLKEHMVPIPPASNFEGNKSNFANSFQQHLNTTVFQNQKVFVSSVDWISDGSSSE